MGNVILNSFYPNKMKKSLNNIFENTENVSRAELQDYLNGQLYGEQALKVERYLADNPLAEEAMEGLSQDPQALSVLPLSPVFLQSGATTGSLRYKNLFWAAASVAILSSVLALYFSMRGNKNTVTVPLAKNIPAEIKVPEINTPEEKIVLEEIENSKPIASKEQITYKKTIENQAQTVNVSIEKEVIATEENLNPVETKKAEPVIEVTENKVAKSNVKFTYIHDLKVIDYSGLYTSGIKKTEQFILSGTPANLDNKNSKNELEPEIRITYISYEKYLDETLLAFAKNDFKTALKNFMVIHQHYPQDLNAFFYGGLCYFNIGKYDKAIAYFDQCIHHSFSTFEEEAQWYKALCLLQSKKKESAIQLLQQIAKQNGFYAQKANAKLKDLK